MPSFILTDSSSSISCINNTTTSSNRISNLVVKNSCDSNVSVSSHHSKEVTKVLNDDAGLAPADLIATILDEEKNNHNPNQVAKVCTSLGDACMNNQQDYDAAMKYYTQAYDIVTKILPPVHPQIADCLCSMGNVFLKRSMFQESTSKFRAALDIYQKAYTDRSWVNPATDGPPSKVDYELQSCKASTCASIGSIEFQQKNYTLALKLFQDALLDSKRAAVHGVALQRNRSSSSSTSSKRNKTNVLKEARMLVADMYSNIASTHAEMGNRPAAIENYNNSLALYMQELGEDHEVVACTLHNIGTMHYRSGEYQLALKCYRQVLKMRRLVFDSDHVCVAECLLNIATAHEKAEEVEKAVSALNAALRIMTKKYGSDSLSCADINMQLGSLYARTGCHQLALEYYELAHGTFTQLGLEESNARIKAVVDAMHYVRNRKDKEENDDEHSLLSSVTESWNSYFSNSCGSFCIPNATTGGYHDVHTGIMPLPGATAVSV